MKQSLMEITINNIKKGILDKEFTVRDLVEFYLNRINKFDKGKPFINSIITINSNLLEEAQKLDYFFEKKGKLKGPLHGVPLVVKDNIETKDIITTFGSIAFNNYKPHEDATIIKKLKNAGAIILAKTNLPDFAMGFNGISTVIGETKNPYSYERTPGGSSAGTAAAIAANFGAVGIGTDTGGSIRVPASFNNLFGLRVTTGLISRNGISPLVSVQDTPGPMARTVEDLSILLDIMVGFDPKDEYTSINVMYKKTIPFSQSLSNDAFNGAKIGILREGFGPDSDPNSEPVNKIIEKSIEIIRNAGAKIIDPVSIRDLEKLLEKSYLYLLESKYNINEFLSKRKTDEGIYTIERLVKEGKCCKFVDHIEKLVNAPSDPNESPEYFEKLNFQNMLRRRILYIMTQYDLDAILFPDVKIVPPMWKEIKSYRWMHSTFPVNTRIASQSNLPAISIPAGFTKDGLPVGFELLGKPYDERKLLEFAFSYESLHKTRKTPEF